MKKKLMLLLFLLPAFAVYAQPKKIMYQADLALHDDDYLQGIERLIGKVVFSHENVIGYCDSAHFNPQLNQIEAYGKRVRIHVNDSTTLYGKYVFYDGNLRIASISREVILIDPSSALYTDSLIYELNNNLAYYVTGGKMINGDNTITSKEGQYYTKINEIILNDSVNMVNPTYTMDCSSLKYDTQQKIIHFTSRTTLISKEDSSIIKTTGGWHDTQQDLSHLWGDVIMNKNTQQISGDTIFYDKTAGYAIGQHNIQIIDSAKSYVLSGHYVQYYEHSGKSTATDSAMLILIENGKDSLYLHADTLSIFLDSLQEPQMMQAFYHVKFFRTDMQGACDSLVYLMTDSVLTLFYNPVLWSGENQITADTIRFHTLPDDNMRIDFLKAGFIVSSVFDETEFNQVKGINITGYIYDKQLYKVDVNSNAECLYYILEEDSSLVGINYSATSDMSISLEENHVKSITLYNNPDGKIYPDSELSKQDRILKDFRWLKQYRPETIADIFHTPMPRNKNLQIKEEAPSRETQSQ